ncbi:PAS domain S-box protein [Azospirillum sp. SYSU D00513]|uniref:PAS domain S-box protein n=1 Tax=Azospirillum sp. SYSU D00513 TaxID=2812561 RepID=UPI001A9737A7|nr:PAS domain S-box protein [Azospirillum sp. SYSU D00513]
MRDGQEAAGPAGGGAAALIAAQDWSASPLGPPEGWPQSLRAVVELVLSSRQAMFVAWGPDLAFVYNDAYAPIFGERRPAAMGLPFAQVWADIWEQILPLVERTLAGEASWYEDLLIPMARRGFREEAWFTFSYTPVRDESGRVAGMFCAASETTEKVLGERRAAFHLELEEKLRGLAEPDDIVAAAEEALGRALATSRVGYGVVDEGARYFTTTRNWTDGTVASHVGTHDLEAFGPEILAALRQGRPVVVHDAATDPQTASAEHQAAFAALEMAAVITASLVKNGRMVAALYVHNRTARRWRPDEIELVREVAERTWSAVERARAELSLRRANEALAEANRALQAEREAVRAANARLAAEGDRLRDLFRQAPGFMCVLRGPDHAFEMTNDAYQEHVGRRDILGKPIMQALPELEEQGFIELLDRVRATGEPFVGHGVSSRLRRRDGGPLEQRWVDFVYQPIRDAEGRVTAIFVAGNDITEARRAVEALRASEERLRIAQEAGGIGTFELRNDGMLAVSAEFCRLWGIPPRPLVPLPELAAIIHPEDRPRLNTLSPGAVPTGGLGYVEYRIRRPIDGELRWVARQGQSVPEDAGGPARVFGVCYDITDRKRAEDALLDLNATLERRVAERTAERDRMWRLSTDIMLVARFDGSVTATNPAWTALLGWQEGELIGTSFLDLVHPDDRAATLAEVGQLSKNLSTMRFENRYLHKDGSYRWISWIAVPEEGFIHAVGRDVTARREADAALRQAEDQLRQAQKMEAVGQLTGGVAHDFNNLLQALGGCLTMIGRRTDEPRIRPLLDAGQQAVDRGAKLVQQLMAFARRDSLRPEPIDVRDRVLGMSGLLERALRADIRLETRFGPGLWPVELDPTQFELALINLAVNARDAMPGGGRLTVEAGNVTLEAGDPSGLEGEFVRLSVADTGTGMPAEVRARAFDPFFTTKEVGKGSGLGLAQVYGLARQAGGTAWIDSEEGRGTTIALLLRRSHTLPKLALPKLAEESGHSGPAAGCGGRLLLVEDDPVVASTVAAALEDAGWRVTRAANADEALAALEAGVAAGSVDVLFSDVVMPGSMSGVDLAREVRRLYPGLPVILATGYSEEIARATGVQVLAKPYRIDDLIRLLDSVLADTAADREKA